LSLRFPDVSLFSSLSSLVISQVSLNVFLLLALLQGSAVLITCELLSDLSFLLGLSLLSVLLIDGHGLSLLSLALCLLGHLPLKLSLDGLLLFLSALESDDLGLCHVSFLLVLTDGLHSFISFLDLLSDSRFLLFLSSSLNGLLDLVLESGDLTLLSIELTLKLLLRDDLVGLLSELSIGSLLGLTLLKNGSHRIHELFLGKWLGSLWHETTSCLLHLRDSV